MIEVAQGSPGSGKSAVAVARALLHLRKGGVVAANFSLVPDWASVVAGKHFLSTFFQDYKHKLALSLHKRFYRVNSLAAIKAINPRDEAVGVYRYKGGYTEGEGLLILDECQLVFNSRKWEKNFEWIEFFTQHRKLHWNVILIAHSIEMIDSQIRPLAEYASTFRNLQKVKVFLGIPLSPIPLFLVIQRYSGLGAGANMVAQRDIYPLPLWAAKLYDSLLVFSGDDWGADSKPVNCGEPPPPPSGGGGLFGGLFSFLLPSPAPTVRRSRLAPNWHIECSMEKT